MDRKEFLDQVCARVRAKSVHSEIREELGSHIDEIKEAQIRAGLPEQEAERVALHNMGSPEEIGLKLDKKHRPRIEWSLLIITAVIAAVGIFVAFAAGGVNRKVIFTLLGLAAMCTVMFFDYTLLGKRPLTVYIVFSGLLLALSFSQAVFANRMGAIHIGGIMIVSPVAQLGQLAPIFLAGVIVSKEKRSPAELMGLIVLAALPFVAVGISKAAYAIMLALAYIILFSVLAAKGDKAAKFLLIVPAAVIAIEAVVIASNPYLLHRITAFMSGGQNDPMGMGYLSVQLSNTVKSARLFGGVHSDFDFLMMGSTSEFALVGILGRFGWIPTISIIALAAAFIWRMFAAAGRIKSRYGHVLALGGCSVLAVKFIYNILMNFGLLPTLGITLPIIGGGGTDFMITMAVIGLILSVYRRNDLVNFTSVTNKKDHAQFWHHVVDLVFGQ